MEEQNSLIGFPAKGVFDSYDNPSFYGTIAKVMENQITIKGSKGKGRRKKVVHFTFPNDKVVIYKKIN